MKIVISTFLLRSLLVLLSLFLCFAVYSSTNLSRLKYSWFYSLTNAELDAIATQREQAAVNNIQNIIQQGFINTTQQHVPGIDMCAVIVTVPRMRRYFYQSLSSLLSSSPSPFPIHIFNAAHPSSSHNDVTALQSVSGLHIIHADQWRSDPLTAKIDSPIPHPWHTKPEHFRATATWKQKELVDYIDTLEYCQDWLAKRKQQYTQPNVKQYTLILEDDIVFTKNFFPKLQTALQDLPNDATFMKLFVTDYWSGWEREDVLLLIGLSSVSGCCLMFLLFVADYVFRFLRHQYVQYRTLVSRKKEDTAHDEMEEVAVTIIHIAPYERKDRATIEAEEKQRLSSRARSSLSFFPTTPSLPSFRVQTLFLFLSCFLLVLFILLSLNKQNMFWTWKKDGIHRIHSPAGTVAQVYPTSVTPLLSHFLYSHLLSSPDDGVDVLLNSYTDSSGGVQYHLVPDLVQHAGAYSSSHAKNQGKYDHMKTSGTFREE